MTENVYLLPRLGWMLYDDINRRLGILIEECLHLQQVVHYFGEFEIEGTTDEDKSSNVAQSEMQHFKQMKDSGHSGLQEADYLRLPPAANAMTALYEHLGGLAKGLKAHQKAVRERYEALLRLVNKKNQNAQDEAWFWFVSLRGHLLHTVLEFYMRYLEHAHEKLIQILETKPGALPQPILLRRWNSALHGRFLSVYSRHIAWETNLLFNNLKDKPKDDKKLRTERHRSSFIHSWAHTPTSMVSSFKVKDHNRRNASKEEIYQLGSIRSAFFYLEMPQLYPLLYHECAHLEFESDADIKNDPGKFFTNRKEALQSLRESSQQLPAINDDFWDNYIDEIWVDMVAINLGGLPYLTALTLQLFGQSAGHFFDSDPNTPVQDWTNHSIYDLEQPTQADYFWQARLKLAIHWLKAVRPEESVADHCKIEMNTQWLEAIDEGIQAYHRGGQHIFAAKRVSAQHETAWIYRGKLNQWVLDTLKPYQVGYKGGLACQLSKNKTYSHKYWISTNLIEQVIKPIVQQFEKRFFDGNECSYDKRVDGKPILPTTESSARRIEYLPFNIKWYLSKRIMKELFDKGPNPQAINTFTFAYANYIRNDGGAAFRIALEWVMARIELNLAIADYLEEPTKVALQIKKLSQFDNGQLILKLDQLPDKEAKELVRHLRYQKSYNEGTPAPKDIADSIGEIDAFIEQFMKVYVDDQLRNVHKEGARIGTMMLGVLDKKASTSASDESYIDFAQCANRYYVDTLNGINNPSDYDGDIPMPFDYKRQKPFAYDINDIFDHKPGKSGMYFITGDYDFMLHQEGITPSECVFHPVNNCALLTKSRTVLDLYSSEIDSNSSDPKERQPWGRISLIKFRYRWEMYILAEQLKQQPFRARLRLSSAWEDGILITWHKDEQDFLNEAIFKNIPTGAVQNGSMDAQTSIILFKINLEGKSFYGHNNDRINLAAKQKLSANTLGEIIDAMIAQKVFKQAQATTGRFDYIVEWCATTPQELATAMLTLPPAFWQHIDRINTNFRFRFKANADQDTPGVFISEIACDLFLPLNQSQ